MTDPNRTISGIMRDTLVASGVPPEHVDVKVSETRRWWFWTGAFLFIALVFLTVGFAVVVKVALADKSVPIVLAVVMAAPAGLFVLFAAFTASQASGEATKAFLDAVVKFRRGIVGKGDA